MERQTPHSHITRRLAGITCGAVLMTVLVACGGSDDTTPTTTVAAESSTETTAALVKNMPRNNCVSVMSGERPPAGVTIPRCTPTGTIAPRTPRTTTGR